MKNRPDALELYVMPTGPCPYLKGQVEQKVITVLDDFSAPLAPLLTQRGFRRTQHMFYRQQCPSCRACLATRLKLGEFTPGDSFKRVVKRNADLSYSIEAPEASEQNYALFQRYLKARHDDGGMADMSQSDFSAMMVESPMDTLFLVCREGDRTLGIMLFDELPDGTSAVYSFYDPAEEKRSLGSWMILKLAEYTKSSGRPYLYLGFWVKNSPKMQYKARFQPLEIFRDDSWVAF